eukprot:CAMPEP_0115027466 /NCGR_PEP_ID=MMETSP0216-20121206/35539_1 /TAXON_ID=223996 /ORGANISM="Protocruzia adherens, Strain Boccale" /LENGTH=517 /DNA_ID=CAMNT_0002403099 /DNA_START=57 /DNA_END=1610 /DNA_ORIENTATION=+
MAVQKIQITPLVVMLVIFCGVTSAEETFGAHQIRIETYHQDFAFPIWFSFFGNFQFGSVISGEVLRFESTQNVGCREDDAIPAEDACKNKVLITSLPSLESGCLPEVKLANLQKCKPNFVVFFDDSVEINEEEDEKASNPLSDLRLRREDYSKIIRVPNGVVTPKEGKWIIQRSKTEEVPILAKISLDIFGQSRSIEVNALMNTYDFYSFQILKGIRMFQYVNLEIAYELQTCSEIQTKSYSCKQNCLQGTNLCYTPLVNQKLDGRVQVREALHQICIASVMSRDSESPWWEYESQFRTNCAGIKHDMDQEFPLPLKPDQQFKSYDRDCSYTEMDVLDVKRRKAIECMEAEIEQAKLPSSSEQDEEVDDSRRFLEDATKTNLLSRNEEIVKQFVGLKSPAILINGVLMAGDFTFSNFKAAICSGLNDLDRFDCKGFKRYRGGEVVSEPNIGLAVIIIMGAIAIYKVAVSALRSKMKLEGLDPEALERKRKEVEMEIAAEENVHLEEEKVHLAEETED